MTWSAGRVSGACLGRVSTRIRLLLAALALTAALVGALSRLGGIAGAPQSPIGLSPDGQSPNGIGESPPALISEPPSTADFVRAYGHGDYSTLEQIASPLYFGEWDRQGVPRQAQASFIQTHATTATGEWLKFTYATGYVDARDFGHYLYVGYPVSNAGGAAPSIWRVDSDSDGRVIWIDLVWLFSARTASVEALPPTTEPDAVSIGTSPGLRITGVLFGVRSAGGRDGYYGVRLNPRQGGDDSSGQVTYYAVDVDGHPRPGAWAFGERFPGRPLPGSQQLPGHQSELLTRYLASLR